MTPLRFFYKTIAAAILLSIGTAFAADKPAKLKLPEIKYEKFTLPNGLTVITHEDQPSAAGGRRPLVPRRSAE